MWSEVRAKHGLRPLRFPRGGPEKLRSDRNDFHHFLCKRFSKSDVVLNREMDTVAPIGCSHRTCIKEVDFHEVSHSPILFGQCRSLFVASLEHTLKEKMR